MEDRIINMAKRTWQIIGGDVLRAVEEAGEKPMLLREEVVEVVMDADHMEMHGNDKEACEHLNSLPLKEQERIVTKAFPLRVYGW